VAANTMLCLVHQTLFGGPAGSAVGAGISEGGGFTERLYRPAPGAGAAEAFDRTNRTEMPALKKGGPVQNHDLAMHNRGQSPHQMIQFAPEPMGEKPLTLLAKFAHLRLGQLDGPLRLNAELALSDLVKADFLINARLFLAALAEQDGAPPPPRATLAGSSLA